MSASIVSLNPVGGPSGKVVFPAGDLVGTAVCLAQYDAPVIESGENFVLSGIAIDSTIMSGGIETVLGGSVSIAATVDDYGVLNVGVANPPANATAYATAQSTTVDMLGVENVYDLGRSSGTHVEGVQNIFAGGVAFDAVIDSWGSQIVYAGGEAVDTTSYSLVEVQAGGLTVGTTLNDCEQDVYGTANATHLDAGSQNIVFSGGATDGSVLSGFEDSANYSESAIYNPFYPNWGVEDVRGGKSSNAIVDYGGVLDLESGGASGTLVNSGGAELISANSVSNGAKIEAGGTAQVWGVANAETIEGGLVYVKAGGVANNGAVDGGVEDVYGRSHAESVGPGGFLNVQSGGVADYASINGGTLTLLAGSEATGVVNFAQGAGGELVLAHSTLLAAPIAGFTFNDTLDLRDIAWGGNNMKLEAGSSQATLWISDGRHVDAVNLLGDYRNANFTASNDGLGGTLIQQTIPFAPVYSHVG